LLDSKPYKKIEHQGMPLIKWENGDNLKIIGRHTLFILEHYERFIWSLCNGKNSIKHIINAFCKKFHFNKKDARKPIIAFILQLKSKGLIDFKK